MYWSNTDGLQLHNFQADDARFFIDLIRAKRKANLPLLLVNSTSKLGQTFVSFPDLCTFEIKIFTENDK